MIVTHPKVPPLPTALPLLLVTPVCRPSFFILLFQRDRDRKKEKPTATKQQLHFQTHKRYNGAAVALPRQHTGKLGWRRGYGDTEAEIGNESKGRVGGKKEGETRGLLPRVCLPVALVAVWQKGLSVSPLICRISQRVGVFITLRVIMGERQPVVCELPAQEHGSSAFRGYKRHPSFFTFYYTCGDIFSSN